MTSEAGSRSLAARLAPSGTPRERASETPSGDGARPRNARSSKAWKPGAGGTKPPNGSANGAAAHRTKPRAGADSVSSASARGQEDQHLPPVRATIPAATPTNLLHDNPLDAILNEAQAAVSDSANTLRDVRERYRTAYLDQVEQWERLRNLTGSRAPAAERSQASGQEAMAGRELNQDRSTLGRIDLAVKSLENAWLFLGRDDSSLVSDPSGPPSAADAQMRIVEAQEAERSRLAREVHDGPAQALSNAIFQVEVVQRLLDRDEAAARAELRQLREVLTRELKGVRAYLSQLRPPLLADLGLSGAIQEAANQISSAIGVPVTVEVEDGVDALPETVEIVALRVVQEALQNARKHAQASSIRIRMWSEHASWSLEVRDDGRGFDADDPSVSERRHFGLQFMRERAELIGARFEVRSSPNLGTAVRMTIPPGTMGMPIPGEES
jgi:signal transduction histidine kinase